MRQKGRAIGFSWKWCLPPFSHPGAILPPCLPASLPPCLPASLPPCLPSVPSTSPSLPSIALLQGRLASLYCVPWVYEEGNRTRFDGYWLYGLEVRREGEGGRGGKWNQMCQ